MIVVRDDPRQAAALAHTEEDLLRAIRKLLSGEAPGVRVGVGDDAALVELGAGSTLLTTDLLVEDVHFRSDTVSPHDLGYKAIAVNVSDVAAMAGSPRYALVGLALSGREREGFVVELYAGLLEASRQYGLSVVGGDLSRADRTTIAVTVVGEVAPGGAVLRRGARPGDRIVVTGVLGASAGGRALAEADPHATSGALGSSWGRALLEAHFRPTARVGEGQSLARGGATAMLDVSDGLALDLFRLCRESEVGALIRQTAIPVAPQLVDLAARLPVDPLELALHGGEDYELLATVGPEGAVAAVVRVRDECGTSLTDIGEVVSHEDRRHVPGEERRVTIVGPEGHERPLDPRGWDHFA